MKKISQTDFINRCKQIHNNKFDYSKTEYINTRSNIIIICPIHGELSISADNHLQKQGCVKCAQSSHKLTEISDSVLFLFKKTHNNKYLYDDLSVKNGTINIICPTHGSFNQIIYHHKKGHGCPECNSSSKGEDKIKNYLENNKIKFKRNYQFNNCSNKRKLRFDFYIQECNTIIEYDGEHHFIENKYFGEGNLEYTKNNDKIKNEYCITNNIKIIRIPYWNYKSIEEILTIFL